MNKRLPQSVDLNLPEQRTSDNQQEFESSTTQEKNQIEPPVAAENAFQQENDIG